MCSYTCTKYLLFFFNFVFWILGLILVGVGLWAYFDDNFTNAILSVSAQNEEQANELASYIHLMAFFVIGLGAVITVIGFFGCCGAVKQNKCLLGSFFFLLLLCFLATVVFGGFLLFVAATADSDDSFSEDVRNVFKESIKTIWQALTDDQRKDFEKANNCCGMDSDLGSLIKNYQCSMSKLTTESCFDKLVDNVQSKFWVAGGVMLAIAVVEIIGMAMACSIFNAIGSADDRYVYNTV